MCGKPSFNVDACDNYKHIERIFQLFTGMINLTSESCIS